MVLNLSTPMSTNARKQQQHQPPRTSSVAPPPRTLNVQKFAESRAPELETLHSILSERSQNDFRCRRNKRRRTTGYDNRVAAAKIKGRKRRRLLSKALDDEIDQKKKKVTVVPRHIRRRAELKKNPETGFCTSGDGTKRLRTHVWHAKRFTMTKLWGFHLPLGLQGGGRGSRALLKWFKHGALVHDASYYGAVQLEGPEDSLLSLLKMVLVPSPSVLSEDLLHSILSGVVYGNAVLHHVDSPVPQSIAPVQYMWRPFHQQKTGIDTEGPNSNGRDERSSFRKLWVWIHASAFSEGYDALKLACVKQMNKTGISINCSSLEGQLAKLNVMGSKSFQLLQKILHPETRFSDNSWKLNEDSAVEADTENPISKSCILENEECISSHAIMSLTVDDPRTLPKNTIAIAPEATPSTTLSNLPGDEAKKNATSAGIPNKEKDLVSSLWLKHEEIYNSALWDVSNGISPPVEENFLCSEKHHLRLDSFCLGDTNSGARNNSNKDKFSRSCPIMLLKDTNQKGSHIGWSIILPISWAKAFWIPLVSNSAHAIGLREKRWIASEVGLPYFPSDFADSSAYSYFKEAEATASDQKAESRPLIERPLRVPIPPPWSCVRLTFDVGSIKVGDSHPSENIRSDDAVSGNSLANSGCQNCNVASSAHVLPFEGFVARTSNMLAGFLNEICGDHLLLFPFTPDKQTSFSKSMKDEIKIKPGQNETSQLNKNRKRCFLRVLLHAYKEGVFEEGAVVCAPQPADIKLWTSGLEINDEGLQIPQSSVSTYFTEQSSGIWELHIPDDSISMESYRWPIGFVTSGFVQGSKKPIAGGLCEATLLASLREEQWKEIPSKRRRKEIYVLVRNLRSTAYRLALATIVLEQQGEDVEFM